MYPNRLEATEITDQIKGIGWLLFLIGKRILLENKSEIVECACLLISVLDVILINLPERVTSDYLKGIPKEEGEDDASWILRILCCIFKLKQYVSVNVSLQGLLQMIEEVK